MKARESTEWCKVYWYNSENSTLPRVLLVGDSIVAGYNDVVAKLLNGRATVAYLASSKCVGDPAIYRELELVMNAYRFKLIHFNNGLHGFTTSEEDYAKGLADYVDAIESMSPESKLVWASSTPITVSGSPDKLNPERNPRVCERNRLAAQIMGKRNIPVDDLYSLMLGRPELSCGDGYHYNQDGIKVQAERVAAVIAENLAEYENYRGYRLKKFIFDSCECMIVEPANPLPGKLWVWKAEFFQAFPDFELEMLKRGFYLAYMNVGNTFGCQSAMKHFDAFHNELVGKLGFSKRPVMLGLSRGGLYIYNWSVNNTDKVACLYADNAVCDFKSWPGGKGKGKGSPSDWAKLQADYGFASEKEALEYGGNPVDNLEVLAKAGIPLVHTTGTEDDVVPMEENTDIVESRYKKLGGLIRVFRHPGGHHPHGLEDPEPLIDFIMRNGIGLK